MIVVSTKLELQLLLQEAKKIGQTIGFVPTMGALHYGHLSLIAKAKAHCDVVVSSIFVNPTQFNNADDLAKYPRTIEYDTKLLALEGCDIVFCPNVHELYPTDCELKFNFGELESVLEGEFRPGHFNGVGLVVSKLFNIVQPNDAFFGQKDLQQFLIINRLVQDLSFPITLHCCEIIRESDGLAMSSRNMRLTAEQRDFAPTIYQTLLFAQKLLLDNNSIEEICHKIDIIYSNSPIKLDYFKFVDANNLTELEEIVSNQKVAICVACYIDEVRLIDNIIFNA